MAKFVWVEKLNVDIDGEWLKVLSEEKNGEIFCERHGVFDPDVFIYPSDVLQETHNQIF